MINPMKEWTQQQDEIINDNQISADAMSDLKTTDNCISTWFMINNDNIELQKCILALTSGFRSLDTVKVVLLDYDKINELGFEVKENVGNTRIAEYGILHRDIANLNFGTLLMLAKNILESVWDNYTKTINKEEITQWLLQSMNEGILEFETLDKNMKASLAASINKMVNKKKIDKMDIEIEIWNAVLKQLSYNKRKTNCKFELECERYLKVIG